jgi:hypothetical protein
MQCPAPANGVSGRGREHDEACCAVKEWRVDEGCPEFDALTKVCFPSFVLHVTFSVKNYQRDDGQLKKITFPGDQRAPAIAVRTIKTK